MILYYTHEFKGGRAESHRLLSAALAKYLGDEEAAENYTAVMRRTGEFGKPVIDGLPDFSISHSGTSWAVLIGDEGDCGFRCGLDIQYPRELESGSIAERFFAEEDAAAAGDEDRFFRIWTRREAVIKAAGGSVADSSIPSVLGSETSCGGLRLFIEDIEIPGSPGLYAAAACTSNREGLMQLDKQEIKSRSQSRSAAEAAYKYLSSRMRTVSETVKHLESKGYDEHEISEAVEELRSLGYLDDYQYALRYYEHNREKKRGLMRAARELAEKGVDAETIRNAGEDFRYEADVDEFEDALAFAVRELRLKSGSGLADDECQQVRIADEKTAGAIARKLGTRGYSRDIIFRVLERLR